MNVDIAIRSYVKDFQWLRYCIASLDKYTTGFRNLLVVVPDAHMDELRKQVPDLWKLKTLKLVLNGTTPLEDDYLGQQITKLTVHQLTDADVFCHVDSDCVFTRPFSPQDLFSADGRLKLLMTAYTELPKDMPWKPITEKFIGSPVDFEFMRRMPLSYHRATYEGVYLHSLKVHNASIANYIAAQPYHAFSEFNALGAWAYMHQQDKYEFSNTHGMNLQPPPCVQYWSWGGITPDVEQDIGKALG